MELDKNHDENIVNDNLSTDKNYMNFLYNKILMYEKHINEKDNLITELNNMVENERIKDQSYKERETNINKQYNKFQKYKKLLDKNISFLQESLINKENKINELENINLNKENEIIALREQIKEENIGAQYKEEIISMKEEISQLKNTISFLTEEIEHLNK